MPPLLFQDSKPESAVAAITLAAVINVAFIWRIMKPRLSSMQTLNAMRGERFRIARDLHDSLSADLSQVAMLCDLALSSFSDTAEVKRRLDQIYELAQTLVRQVHDIVLDLEQGQDSLVQVLSRIENYATKYLEVAQIRCEMQFPKYVPELQVPAMAGRHLLLVIKELLHNVIKHAGATEVRFCARMTGDVLQILIEDNGCGLPDRLHVGHGTCNMHERMALIQGNLEQTSRPGHGTVSHLHLHLKLKNPAGSTHENQSSHR
jgi:signal transduction histidine kinase